MVIIKHVINNKLGIFISKRNTDSLAEVINHIMKNYSIIQSIFIPSFVCMVVPLIYLSFTIKGNVRKPSLAIPLEHTLNPTTPFERNFVFILGVIGLLFVLN